MTALKQCVRCGGTFGCGRNDPDCWCAHLPKLPASALDEKTDCLCPACLDLALKEARDTDESADTGC